MNLYEPFKSKAKNKKYSVYVLKNNKKSLIHFGQLPYGQYKDKLGTYSNLDHNDKKRQQSYLSRAKGIKNKKGELTYLDKNTSNYWAVNYLW